MILIGPACFNDQIDTVIGGIHGVLFTLSPGPVGIRPHLTVAITVAGLDPQVLRDQMFKVSAFLAFALGFSTENDQAGFVAAI